MRGAYYQASARCNFAYFLPLATTWKCKHALSPRSPFILVYPHCARWQRAAPASHPASGLYSHWIRCVTCEYH